MDTEFKEEWKNLLENVKQIKQVVVDTKQEMLLINSNTNEKEKGKGKSKIKNN